jgi:heme-degrading monooxygenase HmoA
MSRIARLPEPPYYAVIAPSPLARDLGGYPERGAALIQAAREVDGFLGIELCLDPAFSLAVSYWRSPDAIDAWRNHPEHRAAKELGKTRWFESYVTRIARVERVY